MNGVGKGYGLLAALVVLVIALPRAVSAEETLYDRLGGKPGIDRFVASAVELWRNDPRVKADFEEVEPGRLQTRVADQICQLSGGPCVYRGRPMGASHAGLHIDRARFNAVAEDLQQAMETAGIPYWTQNRLMALLAPMQRDIVTQ